MAILGIDIGGTKTIVAIADDSGEIISLSRITTLRDKGPKRVLADIESALKSLAARTGTSESDIKAIGIGCGGPLNREKGIILTAPNLPGWDNLPLARHFENVFNAPAFVDNDVNLMALGEARRGAGKGIDYCAYFNIGTGIGGGIIINGKVYRGCGNAGEFGHQIIIPDGPQCLCGRRGCLEALASGTSIARRAREYLADNQSSIILNYAKDISSVTAETVAQAANDGDELALRIWRETGEYIGLGVANVVNILNPRLVIIGGGVSKAGDMLLLPIKETVQQRAMKQLVDDVTIVPGVLGDLAGIIGAIFMAVEQE
ncbi:MAG: ROK family protein [Armatimonadota bacterium]|nr:ROK family protein [Armatimonadota bacterium]